MDKKKFVGGFGMACIFGAYGLSCTVAQTGALAGQGAHFMTAFWGLLFGAVGWGVFALATAYVGYKTRAPKDIFWQNVFGGIGSKFISLLLAIIILFWGGFDTFIAAQAIGNLMPEGMFNVGFSITVVVVVIVTIIGVVHGIPGIKWISMFSVPVAIAIFGFIVYGCIKTGGGWHVISQYEPETISYKTVFGVAHLFVACWMAGLLSVQDLAVESKNKTTTAIGTFTGGFVTCTCFLVGFFGTVVTSEMSLGNICAAIGGLVGTMGCLFTFVAQTNTQPGSALFYTNSASTALKLPFKTMGIILPCICGAETFYIQFAGSGVDTISAIITAVGIIITPIFGTTLTEFYIINKREMVMKPLSELPAFRPAGLITVAVGIVVATLVKNVPFYVLIIIAACCACQLFLRLVLKLDDKFIENAEKKAALQ